MTFLTYLFLTLTLTIQFIRSSSISSSDDGPIIELSKNRSKRYSQDSEERIVGGQYVRDIRKYPYMVVLYYSEKTQISSTKTKHNEAFCTGTLISMTHVLTAAHCMKICKCQVDDDYCHNCTIFKKEYFTLYFGDIVAANSKISRTIKKVHLHEEYKTWFGPYRCVHRFDIAVLELSTPVPNSRRIASIKLPQPVTLYKDQLYNTMTDSFFDKKKKCKILGWGNIAIKDNKEIMKRQLKVAAVPLIRHDRCINFMFDYDISHGKYKPGYELLYPTNLLCLDTSFCSKCPDNRNGLCIGDDGGPIICDGVQLGVFSWFKNCVDPNSPYVYTRVDINVQWIRSIMSNKHDRMPYGY